MDMDEVLNVVECAISGDGHLLDIALPLSCGHFVCKKCIPEDDCYQLKCLKCNGTNQYDLSLCKESD